MASSAGGDMLPDGRDGYERNKKSHDDTPDDPNNQHDVTDGQQQQQPLSSIGNADDASEDDSRIENDAGEESGHPGEDTEDVLAARGGEGDSSDSSQDEKSDDDESDHDSAGDDEDGSDDKKLTTEDGHELSEYEIMRLERIRRNKEYLASLGLDKAKPKPQQNQSSKRPKKKRPAQPAPRRSSLSRSTKKKEISYAEKPIKDPATDQKLPIPKAIAERKKPPPASSRMQSRLDRFIYDEFRHIEAERRQNLKTAEKNLRAANLELRYQQSVVEKQSRREKRRLEREKINRMFVEERRILGGSRVDKMEEFDRRYGEIKAAIEHFDNAPDARTSLLMRLEQQEENRRKMEMLDAASRYPRLLKNSTRELDALLLERAPRDLPPPRRETRRRNAPDAEADSENIQDSKKEADDSQSESPPVKQVPGLSAALAAEALDSSTKNADENEGESVADSASQPRKKRDRPARNVGGWVSPAFSAAISRDWLENDSSSSSEDWDPSSFVPQVGDTLLYYPAGHRLFLKLHPDELGTKTKQIMRLPLWERAQREKDKITTSINGETEGASARPRDESPKWWSEEWLASVEETSGNYPLLCRVEHTHAEFPPDPNAEHRIVKKDKQAGGVQVIWTVPKQGATGPNKRKSDDPLCLAVTLRALTPLQAPEVSPSDDSTPSTLPPLFTVVTFPSRKAAPYLLPFSWVYRCWHSILPETLVKVKTNEEFGVSLVSSFKTIDPRYGDGRLVDKTATIRHILDELKAGPDSFVDMVEKAISEVRWRRSSSHATISIVDALTVVKVWEATIGSASTKHTADALSSEIGQMGMMDLIRLSLPPWKGVKIEGTAARKRTVNAWDLEPVDNAEGPAENALVPTPVPSMPGTHPGTGLACSVDESLCSKIEFTIEQFVQGTPDAAMFSPTLTDELVESYSCAVPLSMSFDRVLRRLYRGAGSLCFYRHVGSLINDLSMIMENCVLYNSPDSDVVRIALEIIPTLKKEISTVASEHFKEQRKREKTEEERQQAIMLQCNSPVVVVGDDDSDGQAFSRKRSSKQSKILREPFEGPLHRSWLQGFLPDGSWSAERQTKGWLPQQGDVVYYSRFLHSQFVQGHNRSLTIEQCSLPVFPARDDTSETNSGEQVLLTAEELSAHLNKRWLVGRVAWARPEFPRDLSKEDDSSDTFECASPVLAIGLSFCYRWAGASNVYKVFWRPCELPDSPETALASGSGHSPGISHDCQGCGMATGASFLVPAWASSNDSASNETPQFDVLDPDLISKASASIPPKGLAKEDISSINRCFDVLKRRCIDGKPADHVDPRLSNAKALKEGWTGPTARVGKVPSFERLLQKGEAYSADQASALQTRGIEKVDDRAVARLAEVHFLPPWMSALQEASENAKKTDRDGIIKSISSQEAVSPSPNQCLELIQCRLRNGYYRRPGALAHDIQEAYVSSVLLILFEPAHRRRGKSFSIRKVAKALSSRDVLELLSKSEAVSGPEQSLIGRFSAEELKCLRRIAPVRQLYGVALVCAIEPLSMERVFGTVPRRKARIPDAADSPESLQMEKIMLEGRRGLGYVISCLSIEPNKVQAPWSTAPILKVRITGTFGDATSDQEKEESDHVLDLSRPILFGPFDLQANDAFVSSFYGVPGRKGTCARCSALQGSVYNCRVLKKHTNLDYDWLETFKRLGSIDDLLHMMKYGEYRSPMLESPDPVTSGGDDDNDGNAGEKTNPPAWELVRDAQLAVELAEKLEQEAKAEAARPLRLSDEFINASFPIDPSDGKFTYCVICGLSGDVMCCEGCPSVVHPACIDLPKIPDEDWFCAKCTAKSKQGTGTGDTSPTEKSKSSAVAAASDTGNGNIEAQLGQLLSKLRAVRKGPIKAAKDPVPSAKDSSRDNSKPKESSEAKHGAEDKVTIKVGTKILKHFEKHGDFIGVVQELPSEDSRFYRVRYEDSDYEDLSEGEVTRLAVRGTQAEQWEEKSDVPSESKETQEHEQEAMKSPKRGRGRPRKIANEQNAQDDAEAPLTSPSRKERPPGSGKKRGRPPKQPQGEEVNPVADESDPEPMSKRSRRSTTERNGPQSPVAPKRAGGRPPGSGKKRGRLAKSQQEEPVRVSKRGRRISSQPAEKQSASTSGRSGRPSKKPSRYD